ncbi:DUF4097 family beta strand repeat-containing protein [Pseudonocardia saturnea]
MPVFETPEPIAVRLDLPHGSVRIVASERVDTRVTVLGDDSSDAAPKVRIEFAGGQLLVKGPPQRRLGWALDWLRGSDPYEVEIELPAGSQVNATVSMGEYRCKGPLGECRLVTDYGDIRFDEGGPVQLTTQYGEIHVDRAVGHAELSTTAGDVRVGGVDGSATITNNYGETRVGEITGELRVEGLYGEVRVDRAHAGVAVRTAYGSVWIKEVVRGTVDLTTTSGELEVGIRAGTAAWLDVSSTTGRIRNSLATHDGPEGFVDTVEIRARTSDGDILIRRA